MTSPDALIDGFSARPWPEKRVASGFVQVCVATCLSRGWKANAGNCGEEHHWPPDGIRHAVEITVAAWQDSPMLSARRSLHDRVATTLAALREDLVAAFVRDAPTVPASALNLPLWRI